ncbi:MAG: DUF2061 domain-containing protein [Alphaproteobacteria bacterium]|nr:DUF2061 domain-containing protein [Alphaproteobacteria bacterium]
MLKDLAKTLTFAALHLATGFGVSYAFTGSVVVATGIALTEPAVNTIVFFFHDRAWRRFPALNRRPALGPGLGTTGTRAA